MRALSEEDFVREAKPVYQRVFATSNPFECPFASAIESRMILFPVHYILEKSLAGTITKASVQLNENSFYLSVLERPAAEEHDRPYHWHIAFTELEQYRSLGYPFVLENAVYSERGTWGLMFTHERHAVLGGPKQFVQAITEMLPNSVSQIEKFLAIWKQHHTRFGTNLDWLPGLLDHVYGKEYAQEMLAKADFALLTVSEGASLKESTASSKST